MDVFSLDQTVLENYQAFARSFAKIRSQDLKTRVEELYATNRFWPEPLVQLNPHYAKGGTIQDFVDYGDLDYTQLTRASNGRLGLNLLNIGA